MGKKNAFKQISYKPPPQKFLVVVNPWGSPGHPMFIKNVTGWFHRMLEDEYGEEEVRVEMVYTQSTHNNIIVELPRSIDDIEQYLGAHHYARFLTEEFGHNSYVAYFYEYNFEKFGHPENKNWTSHFPPSPVRLPPNFPIPLPYPLPLPAPFPSSVEVPYAKPLSQRVQEVLEKRLREVRGEPADEPAREEAVQQEEAAPVWGTNVQASQSPPQPTPPPIAGPSFQTNQGLFTPYQPPAHFPILGQREPSVDIKEERREEEEVLLKLEDREGSVRVSVQPQTQPSRPSAKVKDEQPEVVVKKMDPYEEAEVAAELLRSMSPEKPQNPRRRQLSSTPTPAPSSRLSSIATPTSVSDSQSVDDFLSSIFLPPPTLEVKKELVLSKAGPSSSNSTSASHDKPKDPRRRPLPSPASSLPQPPPPPTAPFIKPEPIEPSLTSSYTPSLELLDSIAALPAEFTTPASSEQYTPSTELLESLAHLPSQFLSAANSSEIASSVAGGGNRERIPPLIKVKPEPLDASSSAQPPPPPPAPFIKPEPIEPSLTSSYTPSLELLHSIAALAAEFTTPTSSEQYTPSTELLESFARLPSQFLSGANSSENASSIAGGGNRERVPPPIQVKPEPLDDIPIPIPASSSSSSSAARSSNIVTDPRKRQRLPPPMDDAARGFVESVPMDVDISATPKVKPEPMDDIPLPNIPFSDPQQGTSTTFNASTSTSSNAVVDRRKRPQPAPSTNAKLPGGFVKPEPMDVDIGLAPSDNFAGPRTVTRDPRIPVRRPGAGPQNTNNKSRPFADDEREKDDDLSSGHNIAKRIRRNS